MRELEGRVAVVTGGGHGIGSGLCSAFAGAGMKVAVADIDEAAARHVAAGLAAAGGEAIAVATDVAKPESVEALAERTERELGGVHVVCNNAGVLLAGPTLGFSEDDWRWILEVNVMGVIRGSQIFGRRLVAQGEGHIVNTASVGGFMAAPEMVPYTTSKAAVVAYSEALRAELAPHGVGVSILCPGPVATTLGDADTRRPAELGDARGSSRPIDAFIAGGIDPREVGDIALEGVREDREYIFTHRVFRAPIAERFERVLSAFEAAPQRPDDGS